MTREEAKQASDWFRNRSKAVTMPGAKRMYLLAIEALSAQPQRKTGKWIPCSERLPEEGVEVLSCTNDGFIRIATYESWDGEMEWAEVPDYIFISDVVAWMPLPKPYGGESDV